MQIAFLVNIGVGHDDSSFFFAEFTLDFIRILLADVVDFVLIRKTVDDIGLEFKRREEFGLRLVLILFDFEPEIFYI